MSQVATSLEPGWRPDPSGRFEWRYWDGRWTNRVANSAPDTAIPAAAVPVQPAPPSQQQPTAPPPPPVAPTAADAMAAPDATPVARVEPFGVPPVTSAPAPVAEPVRTRPSLWARIVRFVQSFADQPESYHSHNARDPLPDDGRHETMMTAAPGNYGFAGITALAGVGIAFGAYLPWLSGTIGIAAFHRSGFDEGLGLGYCIGAAALGISALLAVRMRIFKWLTMGLALVLAGFVARDLLNTYDAMQAMNAARSVDANVGMGLWIMIVSAAIAMIASVRSGEDQKIG